MTADAPTRVWATRLAEWIAWNDEEVEASIRGVQPELFGVRPTASAPSIAFHAWHIGRWVDRHASMLPAWLRDASPTPEIWTARNLTRQWGLEGLELGGYGGTGAGLDDDASARLVLPGVDGVMDYVTATFRAFEAALAQIDDDRILERTVIDLYDDASTVGDVLLNHLSHADRHLGMIEALRGALGERGTATE